MKKLRWVLGMVSVLVLPSLSAAPPQATDIVVRAQARDAKFIGTSVGGAWVRIRDADSGAVLAEGLTEGDTGNTDLIMREPRQRYAKIGDGAAAFHTSLQLSEPTLVTVEVSAPYIKRQARVLSQTQLWLIPGKPLNGDGLIVEVPGMIVDALSPQTHRFVHLGEAPVEVTANVVMMCGCGITAGGLWDANAMEVAAWIYRDGEKVATLPLKIQKQASTFSAAYTPSQPGAYRVLIYAYDPRSGNTGVDQTSFVVAP